MKSTITKARLDTLSYNEAERQFHNGIMSQRDWKRFYAFWHWSCFRYSSIDQDNWFRKYGARSMYQRINRVRCALRLEPIALPQH